MIKNLDFVRREGTTTMRGHRAWKLLVVAFSLAMPAWAQHITYRFERYSLEEGLSQSVVNAVVQDKTGYMWFGTQNGLNRFDGHEFKVFYHQPRNPDSIADNFIRCLYVDRQGQLWIGEPKGLDRYDEQSDRFIHYHHDRNNPNSGHRYLDAPRKHAATTTATP